MHISIPSSIALTLTLLFAPAPAWGGVAGAGGIPDYDFQWSTIGDPGNPAYEGPHDADMRILGRGDVDYEYRMSTREVTTAQWIEFVNTFSTQSQTLSAQFSDFHSQGDMTDPSYNGPGHRYQVNPLPGAADMPVTGMSFRNASLYTNWLHHGKPSDFALIQSGAYDASTFGVAPGDGFTGLSDQVVRSPGAKFWIPNASEWKKATHWDPNKDGPGAGGWWENQYSSDTAPVPGLPGEPGAQTSAGVELQLHVVFGIPLGSYPDAVSPWGLLDTSGAASELLEGWWEPEAPFTSLPFTGQDAGPIGFGSRLDKVVGFGTFTGGDGGHPNIGLRIASAVPALSSVFVLCGGTTWLSSRRKRACIRRRQDYLFMQPRAHNHDDHRSADARFQASGSSEDSPLTVRSVRLSVQSYRSA